jgi:hypothetical protein
MIFATSPMLGDLAEIHAKTLKNFENMKCKNNGNYVGLIHELTLQLHVVKRLFNAPARLHRVGALVKIQKKITFFFGLY